MNTAELYALWKQEESIAHMLGWDFSHIEGRYAQSSDLPWDYAALVRQHLRADMTLLDYDTGGGEFLLSLSHPFAQTAACEGYPPNIEYCKKTLLPLGIDFRACADPSRIPFPDAHFDRILNRHGSFDAPEIHRLLKKGGLFITQQVGADNDRELVDMVLPGIPKPFSDQYLHRQKAAFEAAGFRILAADEAYRPIRFYDVGAFVWFARIIEWEFPGFSVDRCLNHLLKMQDVIASQGFVEGTIHRFYLIAEKI